MTRWSKRVFSADIRPFVILLVTAAVLSALDYGKGFFLNIATCFRILQLFATLGLVALGLGLTMQVREFDLSVAGMFSLAGCVAVLTGGANPYVGLASAVAIGAVGGGIQGLLITGLKLSSVGITLGGLLTFQGLAYVVTGNRSIPYLNMDVALYINHHLAGVLSPRSLVVLSIFLIAALVMGYTRIGRDVMGTGGDRRAAMTAGVNTNAIIVGVFIFSGAVTALGGALLSYGLGAASPSGLSDVLAPAAAAAIIGGVSLSGGNGHPLGIAAGVLVLCALKSGLGAIGVSPYVHDVFTGGILLLIGILDAPDLFRRVTEWKFSFTERAPTES
jgi:ribose/xylose/arabinose/galactoside ABC-type transport system permease subunit